MCPASGTHKIGASGTHPGCTSTLTQHSTPHRVFRHLPKGGRLSAHTKHIYVSDKHSRSSLTQPSHTHLSKLEAAHQAICAPYLYTFSDKLYKLAAVAPARLLCPEQTRLCTTLRCAQGSGSQYSIYSKAVLVWPRLPPKHNSNDASSYSHSAGCCWPVRKTWGIWQTRTSTCDMPRQGACLWDHNAWSRQNR